MKNTKVEKRMSYKQGFEAAFKDLEKELKITASSYQQDMSALKAIYGVK